MLAALDSNNQPGSDTPGSSHSIVNEFYTACINPSNIFGATRCHDYTDIRNRNCVTSEPSRRMGGNKYVAVCVLFDH